MRCRTPRACRWRRRPLTGPSTSSQACASGQAGSASVGVQAHPKVGSDRAGPVSGGQWGGDGRGPNEAADRAAAGVDPIHAARICSWQSSHVSSSTRRPGQAPQVTKRSGSEQSGPRSVCGSRSSTRRPSSHRCAAELPRDLRAGPQCGWREPASTHFGWARKC